MVDPNPVDGVRYVMHERHSIPHVDVVLASDYDSLRLQLSRAKEWMQHKPECLIAKGYDKYAPRTITIDLQGASVTTQHHGVYIGSDDAPKGNCTCGLQGFLKEVGE